MNDLKISSWDDFPNLESTTPFNLTRFEQYCTKDFSVLDIGCGYGRICRLLEKHGYQNIFGIDGSLVQLQRAKNLLYHTRLVYGNACMLPFRKGSFNAALTFGVVSSLLKKEQVSDLIRCCYEVLRPNGYWFVNLYTRTDSPYFDIKYSQFEDSGINRVFQTNHGILLRHYSLSEFLSLVDPFFDIINCQRQHFLSFEQTKTVNGYSILLIKPDYLSKYR